MNQLQHHTKRSKCRLCAYIPLELVLHLKPVPVGEHYSENKRINKDIRYPIDLYKCKNCNAIQTADDIESDFLWDGYTYFSGQTNGIIKHFKNFVESVELKFPLTKNTKIFDIGSNDGSLLIEFKNKSCQVYGVDPSNIVAKKAIENGIQTYVGLFSDTLVNKLPEEWEKVDLITAFNVFAHSSDMH